MALDTIYEASCLIAGSAVEGRRRGEVRNPADTAEVVGTYPLLEPDDVDAAVEGALKAQVAWAEVPAVERAALVYEAAERVAAIEGLDDLLIREQGKVRWEASFEVGFMEAIASYYAELAPALDAGVTAVDDGLGVLRVYHEPVGVVGAITPWNWPLALSAIKVVSALVPGNAIVVKPASFTPLTVVRAFSEIADLFPPGLISVVTGPGGTVGRRLLEHPAVRMVALTGSTETGREAASVAGSTLKKVTLELGGNDAALILDDATVDEMLCGGLVSGAFTASGQLCFGTKRVYAPTRLAGAVAEGMAEILDQYVIGAGLDPETSMGPLNNAAQRDFVAGLVAEAAALGGHVRTCGELRGDPERGYFLRPSVVTGLDDSARLVREEQFGPALPVVAYDDLDDAIARVNDTEFGLASSIWTADEDRGARLARRIHAGATFVNNSGLFAIDLKGPMGGVKQSGVGRELAADGLYAYTEPHTVSTRHM
ncbi:MAG: aldehyde dehydrogenase family protein [Acidimicrobiia bacterium]